MNERLAVPYPGEPPGRPGPCRMQEKQLYPRQLKILIRSRRRVGPPGTRSFLLPEAGWRDALATPSQTNGTLC